MHRLTQFFLSLFSLRSLVLVSAVWLLARGPLPQPALDLRDKVQTYLFRLALHISDLPQPQTQITVIHVPDIEYERWLVDLAGAGSLEQLLAHMDEDALVGMVLEQPLVMVQPVAESLLQEIQQGRRTRDHLYQDANNVLARREGLTQVLTSKRLVLGLMDQSSHFYRRIPVQESFPQYPQFVRDWLWPWPAPLPSQVVSPLLQYFPIDSAPRQARRLASLEGDKVIPMFPLQFWAASENLHSPENMTKVLNWRRDRGFNLGAEQIRTSVTAEVVPVYGAYSGIRTSMKQITLGAALAGNTLSGWILLGRDGSATLEQSAQVIASLGDRAFLFEPAWWSLAQKALLAGLAIYILALLPNMPMRWVAGVTSFVLAGVAAAQVTGQIFGGFWLPVGDLLLFGIGGCAAMLIWRLQRQEWDRVAQRADQSCLALADRAVDEGNLEDALKNVRNCRTTPAALELFYRIAARYEEKGELEESLAALRELRRRRFRYRDVGQRIKHLRASILYRQSRPVEEVAGTLGSEPASS